MSNTFLQVDVIFLGSIHEVNVSHVFFVIKTSAFNVLFAIT
jgi:hypothetical protein